MNQEKQMNPAFVNNVEKDEKQKIVIGPTSCIADTILF